MTSSTKYKLIVIMAILGLVGTAYYGFMGLLKPAGIVPKGNEINDAAILFGQYMGIRSIAIVAMTIGVIIAKQKKVFAYFLLLNGFVQISDSILGIIHSNLMTFIFPGIFGIMYFIFAWYLFKTKSK